ncbi:MAG: SPOR domain-containing protein [Spirochaetaceae bacterium]|jgi:cell division septation protein DedD|nr:SPOR domain-containing protein [Spirochaetaceae bacterium]
MEQKKLLWIVVTVGVFLLIVIGTALILYAPSKNTDPALASISSQGQGRVQPDPDAWVRNPETVPPFSAAEGDPRQVSDLTVVSGNTTVISDRTTFDITGTLPPAGQQPAGSTAQTPLTDPASQTGASQTAPAQNTAAQTSQTQTAPVEQTPASTQTAPAVQQPVTTAQPQTVQQTAPVNTAPKPAATASTPKTTVKQTTTQVAAPAKKQVTEYWIQAGSFSDKMRAEQVREDLSKSKITADVFTRDIEGKTFYRVRTGPYKTKTEAEYWLGVVQNTTSFEDSYISEVVTMR